jgi:hypothetical protein
MCGDCSPKRDLHWVRHDEVGDMLYFSGSGYQPEQNFRWWLPSFNNRVFKKDIGLSWEALAQSHTGFNFKLKTIEAYEQQQAFPLASIPGLSSFFVCVCLMCTQ